MKTTHYFRKVLAKLGKEGKYSILEVGNKKIRIFEPEDLWTELIKIRKVKGI